MKKTVAALVSLIAICVAVAAGRAEAEDTVDLCWQKLLLLSHQAGVQNRAGGVDPGAWYCAGPFKDAKAGLHLEAFGVNYPPEAQAIAAGRAQVDLSVTWPMAATFPGEKDPDRRWIKHDEWVDGYVNPLPTGPAPMKNETCYLYRTITCRVATNLEMRVYALDDVQAWLNGASLGVANNPDRSGASRLPASLIVRLPLESGDNRLLLKITSMHGVHGFAFALPPLTPSNGFRPGWGIRSQKRDLGSRASCSEKEKPAKNSAQPPRYYVRRSTWVETWIATRTEVVVHAGLAHSGPEARTARSALWEYTQKDFGSDEFHREVEWLTSDGIWNNYWETGDVKALHRNYARITQELLGLTREDADFLPLPGDVAALLQVRELYKRAHAVAEGVGKDADFQYEIKPVPMFDPPVLKMADALERATPSREGQMYLERLRKLKSDVADGKVASPRAVEAFWSEEQKILPAIVFIRCPSFYINAIAPYTSGGALPASICVLDPGHPEVQPRVVFHDPQMAIYDMNLSYDARTIFFSARKGGGPWHIYEINVDGQGLKQITSGDSSNISPLLLPSGELMFVSTRAGTHVVCQQGTSGLLYVCNRDGTHVRKVTGNTLSDHTPQIMNDGRVMFTRWDYGVDKNVFCRQKIWTMNPDGTRFQLFFGNTIEDPNGFWQARAIPGRSELVCVFGPHHNYQAGMIGLVWNEMGIEAPRGEGFRWVTRELPSIGDIALPWGYRNPFPLNERQFLVSWGGDGGEKNRLYLLDDRGNRRCLYEAEGNLGCWNPLPLQLRPVPPVIPPQSDNAEWTYRDLFDLEKDPTDSLQGTFLLQDVYEGIGEDVKRGEIKAIQIMEQVPRGRNNNGDSIYGHWTLVGRGTMHVRRIIGVVPVEADGSAYFTAPAIRDISFNALDADGRVVRYMGSTTQVMPGERTGCVGCHDRRGYSPPGRKDKVPLAAKRGPDVPRYPSWTYKGLVEFSSAVQPVLDARCVKCHSGPRPKAMLDLSGDKTHLFSMAYDSLLDRGLVHYLPVAGTGHTEDTAKARGAYVSRLREFIETKHSGDILPLEERQRLYTWIDANVPYYGTTRFHDAGTMGARDRWFIKDSNQWFNKDFVPVFNRRCLECHKRYIKPQTYNFNPGGDGSILVTSKRWTDIALGQFQLGHGRISGIGQYGPDYRINLTHPEWSQMLTAPLAKEAGGFGVCRTKEDQSVFADKNDPDYQAMLNALQKGKLAFDADPREDEFVKSLMSGK